MDVRLNSILSQKDKASLISDISQNRKMLNSGSLPTRLHNDNQVRNTVSSNLNVLNTTDANKDGLLAVC
jgi:hypothetical protein